MKTLNKIQSFFEDDSKKCNYYIMYTVFFVILAFLCFFWFILTGKTFINSGDGFWQHIKALTYYSHYLKNIVRNLIHEHKLIIPNWDFYIGEGSDIVNTLHYYVIGDPLALLSIFIPTRFMHHFYSLLSILRMYLAGIAFSELCFGTGQKNRYGIAAGALSYCFCFWALLTAVSHPYFINPMIFFPLVILGIEKIIKKERPYVFIASVAISAASNFYFFYMIVLLSITYTLIRLGMLYKTNIKTAFKTFVKVGLMAVIGTCVAGIILLPILIMFLSDSRLSSSSQPFHLLYPLSYYSELPAVAITGSNPYWLCMGFTAPAILAIFLLFMKRKEDSFLKVLSICCCLIILFPLGGRILNGMSYMANRWSWTMSLLISYILVKKWNELTSLSKKEWKDLTICAFIYFMVCILFENSRTKSAFSAITIMLTVLIAISAFSKDVLRRQIILLASVMVCAINLSFWYFSPDAGNYVNNHESCSIWNKWNDNETHAVKAHTDNVYTRYTGRQLTDNINFLNKISNTQYFWTLSNPNLNKFRTSLHMREPIYSRFEGYDDRTTPIALSAVQYYTIKDNDEAGLPYGYVRVSDAGDKYSVFKNLYPLPLGYCYNSYITKETWEKLNPVQKQEIQLEAAYVNQEFTNVQKYSEYISEYTFPFNLVCQGKDIVQTENGLVTTDNNTSITLTLSNSPKNAETYVSFEGLEFIPTPEYDLYSDDSDIDPNNLYNKSTWNSLPRSIQRALWKNKKYWNPVKNAIIELKSSNDTKKIIEYYPPDAPFSSGRHDFIANMGYSKEPMKTVTLTFAERGIYNFSSLKVYSIPMDDYAKKIEKLQKDTLKNITFDTDTVYGEITLDSSKIFCMAIPYSKGWQAYIDGKQTDVLCLNERYIGIVVPNGSHTIRFHYSMPYKKEGFYISIAGFLALTATIFVTEKKKKVNSH